MIIYFIGVLSPENSDEYGPEVQALIEKFRKKALNLLEMLDLSQPSVGKLRVICCLHKSFILILL